MNSFSAREVTVKFKGGASAIREFDLDFNGGALAVYGDVADGKTAIISALAGLRGYDGDFILNGSVLPKKITADDSRLAVLEDFCLLKNKTVYYNIEYPMLIRARSAKITDFDAVVRDKAAEFGISEYLNVKIRDLNAKIYPYVALARVGLFPRDLYLFDDIFKNLAAGPKAVLAKKLKEIFSRTDGLKIFATSDFSEAAEFGEKICALYGGVIEQYGTYDELKHNPSSVRVAELCSDGGTVFNFARLETSGDDLVFYNARGKTVIENARKRLLSESYSGCDVLVAEYPYTDCGWLIMDAETDRSVLI